ncbi:ATAD2, partial [Cordylochernes scorpioides]
MKEDISEGEEESEEEEEGENEMTTEEEEEEEEDEEGRRRSKRCKNSIYKSLNIFDSSPSSRYKRCLPMNYKEDQDLGISRDPAKLGGGVGISDTKPMNVDESITFESIGGLDKHIADLKEMVMFPLLYPEVFAKFKARPAGGRPLTETWVDAGTGKTLVARALANEISKVQGVQYSFFMRKGADCFSKWVGESERHIRVLFDQAYQMRPSIIFFDEIDGLAPVRTSRQDQIHCSIVSTLLSVMDGLDSRGEIVVIGATNRIDALDPALRRPGRFDREFHFPLPNLQVGSSLSQANFVWIKDISLYIYVIYGKRILRILSTLYNIKKMLVDFTVIKCFVLRILGSGWGF